MNTMQDINALAEEVRVKLEEKLRVKARSLPRALAKAGRRLPRRFHKDAGAITAAQDLNGHPKLLRMINLRDLEAARDRIVTHLDTIDPADIRRGKLLALLGDIAFKLLFVCAAFIAWLWWRGYI